MAFKFIVLAAFVAVASAGGPAAYDIGTLSADHSSIGYSQESTQKGYAGQNVVSTYSRAEDSAHSSVRVSNSHVSNDALLEHHAIGYAAAAPVITKAYAAPTLAKPIIAAQPVIAKAAYAAHPGPVLAKTAYAAAPAYGYAAAPVLAKTTYAAPAAYGYAAPAAYGYASPLLAKSYAAPAVVAKTAAYTTYAAPATPVIAKATYAPFAPATTTYAAAAPLITKTTYAAAPILAKTAIAAAPAYTTYAAHPAPIVAKTYAAPYSYETAAPVAHATFSGFGTSYAW
ncbi:Cuticle protein 21.3 [Ooceraea biroi]|uniref:Cuticle protein 21.3 n=1 Tax=Ooceraea biroi TaxID=2015173 RepID=A0A026VZJ5_OOCBI|nr:Cuticle protein 21.3 [Ooceraea biroi]